MTIAGVTISKGLQIRKVLDSFTIYLGVITKQNQTTSAAILATIRPTHSLLSGLTKTICSSDSIANTRNFSSMGASVSTPNAAAGQPAPAPYDAAAAAGCPVDHKTREVWLRQNQGANIPHPMPPLPPSASLSPPPAPDAASSNSAECSSDSIGKSSAKPTNAPASTKNYNTLSLDREISSIPRAFPESESEPTSTHSPSATPASSSTPQTPYTTSTTPSNSEGETGHDKKSGNWIYPSERMFFDAMSRKSHSPNATDMRTVVPIHNAVNERAWSQILAWERSAPSSDPGSASCGGPKLYSFKGMGSASEFMSPKARWNSLLGYQAPFDRHDWVVQRCSGERVEYVIDFYEGRSTGGSGKLSFYLDVRPKLNTWEGARLRTMKVFGLA